MADARLLEVGRVTRAHGIRGEVLVELVTDRLERVAPGTVLTSSLGDLVIETSRPHQGKHLVRFAGVDDRTAAEGLHGVVLRAEPLEDPEELFVHQLIGATVVEGATERGRVVAVVPNPASDLLELDSGALVPVRFVVGTEPPAPAARFERVLIEAPEGLFDLE